MASSSRRHRGAGGHDNDERWLLTYADMITLLMALFMVLFSISSVNVSKFKTLQKSLKAAFSGSILPGGRSIIQSGSQSTNKHSPATSEIPSIVAASPNAPQKGATNAVQTASSAAMALTIARAVASASATNREQSGFAHLKQQLDSYARAHGIANQVQTVIDRRGLVVRVLTDQVLFDSGEASLKPVGLPLLGEVASLLNVDRSHPIVVEGHTDNVPIASAQFPTNWELSTARATTVVRYLIANGVNRQRLGAAGYADLHSVSTNGTAAGRALNRRVEIVFQRLNPPPS